MTSTCTKCKCTKHISFFYIRKSGKTDSWCKKCNSEYSKVWRAANKKRHGDYSKNWRKQNMTRWRNQRYTSQYGITVEQYDKLLLQQVSCCALCGVHQHDVLQRLAVDHDHKTGKVRGLLCSFCNQGLGHFKDDKTVLARAIKYLEHSDE